jgi:3-phenylpropionate/cinnamic acid dioxygenase small subunit
VTDTAAPADGAQLARVLDREAVVDTCVRYATALDRRDWSLLRTCFLPDATGDYAGIGALSGYDEIERVCRRALEPLAASQHLLGNFVVALDGNQATVTCYLHAQHVRPGTPGGDTYVVAGTYTDRHVRTPDGWRIAHRRLEVTWTQGNPAVLATRSDSS